MEPAASGTTARKSAICMTITARRYVSSAHSVPDPRSTLLSRQFFTCGSSKVAQGVKKVLTEIITDRRFSDERAAVAFEKAFQGRYTTNIFEA